MEKLDFNGVASVSGGAHRGGELFTASFGEARQSAVGAKAAASKYPE
jgi:hypothetical protein